MVSKGLLTIFLRQLKELETLLGIYQSDLHHELEGLGISKGIYVRAVDLFVMTCPQMRASSDLSTGFILFPSGFQTRRQSIKSSLNSGRLRKKADRDISAIKHARTKLSDFIKTNLPLEKVLS